MKLLVLLAAWLPLLAAAQALPPAAPAPAPLAAAAPDSSAGWEIQVEVYRRTSYLGREYGRLDYSVAPQVTYSAASGFYGTLEGLYFSPVRPAYVYTSLELGYANELTDAWSFSLSGNRTFYTGRITRADSVLRNCLEAYTAYDLGPISVSLDYNFLFDRFHAHTLGLGVSLPLTKAQWLGFDKVSCTPAAEFDWGSTLALLRFGTLATPLDPNVIDVKHPSMRLAPLTYEFTLPLEMQRGPLALSLTGHLLVPLRVRGETQAPTPFGYLSAALMLRLPRKPATSQ